MIQQQPIYVVDIVGKAVATVSDKIIAQITSDESDAIEKQSLITTINYQFGSKAELIETLAQMDKGSFAFGKYPCVYLVFDFAEHIGETLGFYGTAILNIIIMHQTDQDYKTTERYVKVFKPVLYPIYNELIVQLSKYGSNGYNDNPSMSHTKTDRPKAKVPLPEGSVNYVNDYVDAIEISNLNLLLDYQTCIN